LKESDASTAADCFPNAEQRLLPILEHRREYTAETRNGIIKTMPRHLPLFLLLVTMSVANAFAQSVNQEPIAVVEIGGAAGRSLTNHESSFGPTVAVEATAIDNWLELEAGVTPLFGHHSTEWGTDLIFKKPWTLSQKAEFMLGLGPEWIHTSTHGVKANSIAIEVAPDFMFWPAGKHRFGWYLEPSYEYTFGPAHEHSVSVTGALLIAISRNH
jgi:hypothetical protein